MNLVVLVKSSEGEEHLLAHVGDDGLGNLHVGVDEVGQGTVIHVLHRHLLIRPTRGTIRRTCRCGSRRRRRSRCWGGWCGLGGRSRTGPGQSPRSTGTP